MESIYQCCGRRRPRKIVKTIAPRPNAATIVAAMMRVMSLPLRPSKSLSPARMSCQAPSLQGSSPVPAAPKSAHFTGLPSSSQFAATFLLGCTRGGSPGIFG
jgi:hypothetical protein